MSGDLDVLIARLRALLAEATPGPWWLDRDTVESNVGPVASVGDAFEGDAALIAELVTAAPAILDALESAQAAEAHLRAANGRARDRAIAAGLAGADLAGPEEIVEALVLRDLEASEMLAEAWRERDEARAAVARTEIERLERMIRDQQGDLRHADRLLAEALGERDEARAHLDGAGLAAFAARAERARADREYARGVAEERARVVTWLRASRRGVFQAVAVVATRIERGDHAEGGDRADR
jgi:hypothetical protein